MSVQGVQAVIDAIKGHQTKTVKGLRKGLLRAGLFLQREAQKLTPIDTGVLRASATTRIEGNGFDSTVVVGFGTDYGIYVHENLDAKHAPGTQAKFLTTPLIAKKAELQRIVLEGMRE